MADQALQIVLAVYFLWIGGLLLSVYLMLTNRFPAFPMRDAVLIGTNAIALLMVLYAITNAAGVL